MKQVFEIGRKELRMLMFSPLGWLVLITLIIQLGSFFSSNLSGRTASLWSISEFTPSLTFNMLFTSSVGLISGIAGQLYLYIPLLTMGLMSKEYSDGTIKLLYSSPLKIRHIVLGKFFSIASVGAVLTGILGLYALSLHWFVIKDMDTRLLLWGLVVFFLLVCTYASIGLFVSSLTSYQFVAALGTVSVLFFLDYSGRLSVSNTPEIVSAILGWLQGTSFFYSFKGYIGTWDILYFLLVIALFLGLTFIRLKSVRENISRPAIILRYILLVTTILMVGYISSRPFFKYYFDVRNPVLKDTKMFVDRADLDYWRTILMQVIPATIIIASSLLIWRRRNR